MNTNNPAPGNDTGLPAITIGDLYRDSIMLHALAQGVEVLFDQVELVLPSPAANSLTAIIECLVQRADKLTTEMSVYEMMQSRKAK